MTRTLRIALVRSTLASAALLVSALGVAATVALADEPDRAEHLVTALAAPVGDPTQVTLQVLAPDGTRSGEMVVVAVEGGDEAARMARAQLVRQQLALLGVAAQQIFVEGAPDQ